MQLPKLKKKEKNDVTEVEILREDFLNYRFKKVEKKANLEEFVRLKFNIYAVTALIAINVFVLFPLALETWLFNLLGAKELAVFNYTSWWLFILFWICPYLTWQYSTITIPIVENFKTKLDWSQKKKGRMLSAIFNLTTFHVMTWAAWTKYIVHYYLPYLSSLRVGEQFRGLLIVDDLDSFILILFVAPVIVSAVFLFIQVRDYLVNKDLLADHFMEWEAPYFARYAHQLELDSCDIIVGYEIDTKKPIVIKEDQRYLHEAVIGATGSGKTSTTILLRIAQDLVKIATGRRKMGLVLLEPKGDAVDDVITLAKKLGIPQSKIKVIDPKKAWSIKYNPFAGARDSAAASFQGTLNALTEDQDDFFKGQQNETAQFFTLLAKIRYGNKTNITHIQRMFTDPRYLADIVEAVRASINETRQRKDLTEAEHFEVESVDQIVTYFENEILDYKQGRKQDEFFPLTYPHDHPQHAGKQIVENKKDKFVTGAKKYLNEIALNSLLKTLFTTDDGEEVFDPDQFLLDGGILLVNTCLPELEELSLMFGQFFIRQFQSAIFRRPKENRIPIFFYIDEFPLYVNEAFARILTLARSYKVGALIAMQSIAQLDSVGSAFKDEILGNSSSKTVFGRGPGKDNEYFSEEFGEMLVIEESLNESASPMVTDNQTWGYRLNTQKKLAPRFTTTDIKSLKFKEMIVQVVDETNSIDYAKKAIGKFVHEAKFIQRYMDLAESDIKSTREEAFDFTNYIDKDKVNMMGTNVQSNWVPISELGEDVLEDSVSLEYEPTNTATDTPSYDEVPNTSEEQPEPELITVAANHNSTEEKNVIYHKSGVTYENSHIPLDVFAKTEELASSVEQALEQEKVHAAPEVKKKEEAVKQLTLFEETTEQTENTIFVDSFIPSADSPTGEEGMNDNNEDYHRLPYVRKRRTEESSPLMESSTGTVISDEEDNEFNFEDVEISYDSEGETELSSETPATEESSTSDTIKEPIDPTTNTKYYIDDF